MAVTPPRLTAVLLLLTVAVSAAAQTAAPQAPAGSKPPPAAGKPQPVAGVPVAPDYVIGPDDVLAIVVWREKDISGEVAVRPDGKISLPLLNDVQAAGFTPEELRKHLTEVASKFIEEPEVTVIVKAVNSRKVYITGQVAKPGPYSIGGPTNVLQLIAMAGGVLEFADTKNIVVMRNEKGQATTYRFNYNDVLRGRNLKQNIELKPGDTVVVP